MRIAILGAGVSGLVAAAVLRETGHQVTVFERCDDIGGVWSSSRRYPGVSTQDDRVTYSFSDSPMPRDFPEHPSGPMVQAYLQRYAEDHGLLADIHLRTEVLTAELVDDDSRWELEVRDDSGTTRRSFDHLVAAHGTYSTPHIPDWPGRAAFEAAGGLVVPPSSIGDGALLDGRDVVVLGWGKTACDVAVVAADRARTATLVARELRWKYPKRIGSRLTFRHLLLTRLGEHAVASPSRGLPGRLLTQLTRVPRKLAMLGLARVVDRQLGLSELGLLPRVTFPDSNSLVTEGFYEAVRDGRIDVVRDAGVADLEAVDGVPSVRLRSGAVLPARVLVPATGYEQDLDFLAPVTRARLLEPDGSLLLHRKVLPTTVPRLAFIGWSQSYRSPLTAEVQAFWLAGLLLGRVRLPSVAAQRRDAAVYRLTHAQAAAAGAPQMPSGSFGELDVLLEDLRLPLPRATRRRQLLTALDPADYAYVLPVLRARARLGETQSVPA
ncbi:flavin-containing monooxygenase [Amnibacterium kyonggiense]|uniref:Cation diffusion facilitator CzcD-associated flavoprotein CzcO n=1 Tax=Amnibacterium kyonggiense TaxID=595671 RepID=A0A4R7FFC4_9MICO|nr:NAD(P)/FAD-dependent oxidoreductase [Amnibacterium kyonggiense]TDS74881.1 cation diffusion facilitator CzcD-associated flavoprotein CzcO [Amnibacterium kyonggiense]